MKVYDILTESKKTRKPISEDMVDDLKAEIDRLAKKPNKTKAEKDKLDRLEDRMADISTDLDEGPLRYIKRTLGKNTAGGKAAQLDVEIDKEVSDIYKDFYAVSKQDPKMKGMTAKGLAKFLVAKGFASKPSAVMSYINAEPGIMRSLKKSYKSGKDAAKSGAAAVTGAASKLKAKLSPQASGLTGADAQGNLDLTGGKMNSSMYSEAQIMEADVELSKGQVQKVIKRFVQQGFQANLGKSGAITKSAYGDAPADTDTKKTSKAKDADKQDADKQDAKDMATPTMDVDTAKAFLQSKGYTVTLKKKAKKDKDPADVNNDGKVSDDERRRKNYADNMDTIRANSKK